MRNPLGELSRVGDRGREEDVVNVVRQQNDRLLPDDSSFLVPHVVDLVEDDPTNLASDFWSAIKHGSQDFGSHNLTGKVKFDFIGQVSIHKNEF